MKRQRAGGDCSGLLGYAKIPGQYLKPEMWERWDAPMPASYNVLSSAPVTPAVPSEPVADGDSDVNTSTETTGTTTAGKRGAYKRKPLSDKSDEYRRRVVSRTGMLVDEALTSQGPDKVSKMDLLVEVLKAHFPEETELAASVPTPVSSDPKVA